MTQPVHGAPEPRHILAALVRREGRARITARELREACSGKLGVARTEAGDLVVTWVETPYAAGTVAHVPVEDS
jgi:hypothetical protein